MSLDSESVNERRQRLLLEQALDYIRRRDARALGPMPRRRGRRRHASGEQLPTPVETISTIEAEADAADAVLKEMFADGKMREPRYRRYVLVQRPDGRLEFRQDELDVIFEEELAVACGRPKPRARVIRIDLRPATRS